MLWDLEHNWLGEETFNAFNLFRFVAKKVFEHEWNSEKVELFFYILNTTELVLVAKHRPKAKFVK